MSKPKRVGRPRQRQEGRRSVTMQLPERLIAALDDVAFEQQTPRVTLIERILTGDPAVQAIFARVEHSRRLSAQWERTGKLPEE